MTSPVDGMLLLYVPAGNFTMGDSADHAESECIRVSDSNQCIPDIDISFTDEAPAHTVYLDAFWIDQTEVTNAMFFRCVQAGKCASNGAGNDNYPVVNVSWSDASAYCVWAERRLPTEAEWEKAARGTDGRTFPWGNDAPSCSLANFAFSSTKKCAGGVATVGSFPAGASPYGALDMAGNVWEWVADWFAPGYPSADPVSNPTGPATGTKKVVRGGSNWNPAGFMTTTGRGGVDPNSPNSVRGFRCAANP
jgi:formylglycine-generating enzyme required for sulfatase activity